LIIQKKISLKTHNTFGIDVFAKSFVEITSEKDLKEVLKITKKRFILGGGSNILLTKDIEELVIKIALKGIKIVSESDDNVVIRVSAGENWHQFVLWALQKNYGGIENLSLIPGNVGTAPIQNIGAYGVELKDIFLSCETIHTDTLEKKIFSNNDCEFDYRSSIFKQSVNKGKFIITAVTFKLSKKNHKLHTRYGAIEVFLSENNIKEPTIQDVSKAVISIRKSKLPDPAEIGNSGSFFKNPIISKIDFERLYKKYSTIPHYILNENEVKIPAGWLIEQCHFKGKRYGDAGVHEKQALVLVNYGNAKGSEILKLSKTIQGLVKATFNIVIEAEVNIM